jgi:hypothetical protein
MNKFWIGLYKLLLAEHLDLNENFEKMELRITTIVSTILPVIAISGFCLSPEITIIKKIIISLYIFILAITMLLFSHLSFKVRHGYYDFLDKKI